jgi:small subunit ribosomal protein S14
MARKALVIKHARRKEAFLKAIAEGRKPKFPTRVTHRCTQCGRNQAFIRHMEICRICFRELAAQGKLAGIKKSSW